MSSSLHQAKENEKNSSLGEVELTLKFKCDQDNGMETTFLYMTTLPDNTTVILSG